MFLTIIKYLGTPLLIGLVFLIYFTTNPNYKKKKPKKNKKSPHSEE